MGEGVLPDVIAAPVAIPEEPARAAAAAMSSAASSRAPSTNSSLRGSSGGAETAAAAAAAATNKKEEKANSLGASGARTARLDTVALGLNLDDIDECVQSPAAVRQSAADASAPENVAFLKSLQLLLDDANDTQLNLARKEIEARIKN